MVLSLKAPEPTTAQLRAIAASGSTGLAKKAQAALRDRVNAELAKAVGRD